MAFTISLHSGYTLASDEAITVDKLNQMWSSGYASVDSGTVGTDNIADEAVTTAKMADLTRGYVLVGQTSSNRPVALAANGDAEILIGDGTDVSAHALTGDVTMTNAGVTTVGDRKISLAKMANLDRGYLIVGQTGSNEPTAMQVNADGQILIGDGTDLNSKAISGDVTLTSAGVVSLADDTVATAELHETTVQYVEVSISTTNVKSLNSSPVTIVPAPGEGKAAIFAGGVLIIDYESATYGGITAAYLKYNNYAGATVNQHTLHTTIVSGSSTMVRMIPYYSALVTVAENAPIVLTGNADPITGDSPLRVKCWYRVIETGL